jgi:hypothetical protein
MEFIFRKKIERKIERKKSGPYCGMVWTGRERDHIHLKGSMGVLLLLFNLAKI